MARRRTGDLESPMLRTKKDYEEAVVMNDWTNLAHAIPANQHRQLAALLRSVP
jgi:hypothetical protein